MPALISLALALLLTVLAQVGIAAVAAPAPAAHPPTAIPAQPDFSFASPYFEKVGDDESIPGGIVTALAQDGKGLLWIGTQHGLIRHDGYRFRKFAHANTDPASLPDDYIRTIWPGRDGRLWIGTSGGLSVFDPGTGRFENYRHDPTQSTSIVSNIIRAITGDASGAMWLATENGLDYLPPGGKSFTHYRHNRLDPASLADDQVRSLLLDRQKRLWVGSGNGLQRLRRDGKGFESIASDPADPASLAGQSIQALFEAADGKLWLGTLKDGAAWLQANPQTDIQPDAMQLHRLAVDPARFDRLTHGWIKNIVQPQADRIWLGTVGGGINVVNASDGRVVQRLRHDDAVSSSLALDQIGALLVDQSGLLWVGTWASGLQRHNAQNRTFRILRHSPDHRHGLSHHSVYCVLELADGTILAGLGRNRIDIIDRQRGLIGGYQAQSGKPGALPDDQINALAQTPDGALWAATLQSGVLRHTPGRDNNNWQTFDTAQGLPANQATALFVGRDGRLWAGTSKGLARWQAQTQRFEAVPALDGSAMQAHVNVLAEDPKGRILAGTEGGLHVLEAQGTGLRAIRHDPYVPASLRSDRVGGLLFDNQGRLWVSTSLGLDRLKSSGMARSNQGRSTRQDATFEHIDPLAGPADVHPGSNLLADKTGRIWAGATVIDPVHLRIHALSKADGFDIGNPWTGAFGRTRDGLFLYGGTQGLAIADPVRFQPWDYQAPVRVTELKIDGLPVALGALLPGLGLPFTVHPGQHNFSIEFAALDYSAPQMYHYAYRLLGQSEDWVDTDAEHRTASYGNLWPGKYTLQVRASNQEGTWNAQQLHIAIRVLPAFWQTWWFLVLMLLLSGSTMQVVYRWRVARLLAEAKTWHNLVDARTADILKLGRIGQELTATLDTEQAFERVYRQVSARLDAHVFLIGIVDEEASCIEFVYQIEHQQRLPNEVLSMDEHNRPAVWCVREQHELVAGETKDLLNYVSAVLAPSAGDPMETVVYLPLLVEQRVIGCLSVQSPQRHAYSKDQLEFLRILASYTAIALSNSAAHNDLTQSHEKLAATLQYLKETQAKLIQAERQQISLDLHDNLSQTMTGILLQLDTAREVLANDGNNDGNNDGDSDGNNDGAAEHPVNNSRIGLPYVDRAIELARDGITQTRHLLNQLRLKKSPPPPIGIVQALRRDLPRLTVGTPIKVIVEQHGDLIALQGALELVLFRIAQEAVTNALRHANPKTIRVLLTYQSDCVILAVSDDGRGFELGSPSAAPGIGLLGMRERITALAGALEVESSPGKGTSITATMPLTSVRS
jgi:signal transduction histidine kinase/ligand-binding sensor domain-containing protein